jgi:hypothetical protein
MSDDDVTRQVLTLLDCTVYTGRLCSSCWAPVGKSVWEVTMGERQWQVLFLHQELVTDSDKHETHRGGVLCRNYLISYTIAFCERLSPTRNRGLNPHVNPNGPNWVLTRRRTYLRYYLIPAAARMAMSPWAHIPSIVETRESNRWNNWGSST